MIRKDAEDVDAILEPPENQDDLLWQYEHLRYAPPRWTF